MHKHLLLLLLLLPAITLLADDHLVVGGRDGQVIHTQDLSTLQKLTFSPTAMQIHTTDGEVQSIALEGMGRITFDSTEGIDLVKEDLSAIEGEVTIYSIDGRLVKRASSWDNSLVQTLTPGNYVAQIGKRTIKFSFTK